MMRSLQSILPTVFAAIFLTMVHYPSTARCEEAEESSYDPEAIDFFESKIRPVLIKECYSCHSNQTGNARGGLRLDTRQLTRIGGDSGPSIVPGDLDESTIWAAINHEGFEMPPRKKLSSDVIEDFRVWIENGAADPRETKVTAIASTITQEDIEEAKESFWAYQSPKHHEAPASEWASNDIDRFLRDRLMSSGLEPNQDADPLTVLRRLTYDLVGLAPTSSLRETFLQLWKQSPEEAIARAADHLLDQPEYGERWGRHWLDVARFAESTGSAVNVTYPHSWRYRDYVIDSFNDDKPYDQFVQEQIAGDLLLAADDNDWTENLIATTFLAMGVKNLNEQNPVQFAADLVDEQIDVTTRVFMGQSVACARCHDHKFDPIPQTDYYAMAGMFASTKTYFGNPPSEFGAATTALMRRTSSLMILPVNDPNPFDRRYSSSELADLREQINQARQEMRSLGSRQQMQMSSANSNTNLLRERLRLQNSIAILTAKLAVVDDDGQPRSYCMGVQDRDKATNARVLVRGEIDAPGQLVDRGVPEVLARSPIDVPENSSGRLQLARFIGSDQNPVAARVMVNRVWIHLFGQGIVTTPENFGFSGNAPSHPKLLDHLATEFVENKWSIKSLIREMVTSRAYRLDSTYRQTAFETDPENKLLWRFSPRRLDAESIRDSMLQISGKLDRSRPRGSEVAKAGFMRIRDGILVNDREAMQNRMRQTVSRMRRGGRRSREDYEKVFRQARNPLQMEDAAFRSVYLPVVRDFVPRSLEVFDFADPNMVVGARESSNTANQALYLMNNPFVIEQSERLAKRIQSAHDGQADQAIAAFVETLGRKPSDSERLATIRYLRTANLAAVCQGLFASAEFRLLN